MGLAIVIDRVFLNRMGDGGNRQSAGTIRSLSRLAL
jgi:hypothetical protein